MAMSKRSGGEKQQGIWVAQTELAVRRGIFSEQQAVYRNRHRVRGEYGKSLLRRRGEMIEHSFVHCYDTGGMRRCHLRGRHNILKRQLIHVERST
jgi:hypothetical protein